MSLMKSVATFGGFTLISRVTGFIRDMVLANFLGAGSIADAFFVAFKLPNLFRNLFAEGAFSSAFVPMLSHKMVSDGRDKAIRFASRAISVLAFFLLIFVIIMEFFMPELINILAPGFREDPEKIALAADLSRITFPFLLFISIVSFQSGILNSLNKFAAPAAAPVILNLMMILSVFIFTPFGETPAHGIAVGITVAGFLEILWLHWFLKHAGVKIRLQFNIFRLIKAPDIKTLFKRIAPGVLGSGIYQINMMIDTIIVSLVGTGAISWLYYANRLQQLPLGVIGAAISVALLPILSKQIKAGADSEAFATQNRAVEYGALFSIPAALALIILAEPIINLLFQHGAFGEFQTRMTALAVITYSVSLPVYVLVKALTPNFFARGDTKTPVKYSIVVLISNMILAILLVKPFGHVGVAAATTISAFISFEQYRRGLKKRGYWNFTPELRGKINRIFLSALVMGLILYAGKQLAFRIYPDWLSANYTLKIGLLGGLCILGVASFGFMAKLTGVLNINDFLRLLPHKGKKHVDQN